MDPVKADTGFNQCSICLNEDKGVNYPLDCSHVFHKSCIATWVKKNPSCPTCRGGVSPFQERDLTLHPVWKAVQWIFFFPIMFVVWSYDKYVDWKQTRAQNPQIK